MLYLDTNALYYAAEISNGKCDVEKLRDTIAENKAVAISSVSLCEFVMRFKDNIEIIHKGGKFLGDNHISIGFNKYFPRPKKLPIYWNAITENQLEVFVDDIRDNKIDVESRFASICFSICFMSIADFMVKESAKDKVGVCYIPTLRNIMKKMNGINMDIFKSIVVEGYNTNDCENYLRKCFDNYMEYWLQCFVPILIKANEVNSYKEYHEIEKETDWDAMSKDILKKINRSGTTMEFIKKKSMQYWKQMKEDHFEEFLSKLRESVNKMIKEEAIQEYITDIIQSFLLEGSSFWKNDILDAIIMCHLTDEDKLVTFDNGAIKHMEKYEEVRLVYKNSLNLIRSLKIK